MHARVKERAGVQVKLTRDALAMLMDLRPVGESLRRHVAGFFQQGHIAIGVIVALNSRIAVPIPDPAEVAGMLDDPEIVDARLLQMDACQHPREASAENRDVQFL